MSTPVSSPAADAPTGTQATPIGVAVGATHLLAAAPVQAATDGEPSLTVSGAYTQAVYDELAATLQRIEIRHGRHSEQWHSTFSRYYTLLNEQVAKAAVQLWEFLAQFEAPVIVLEDLPQANRSLAECLRDGSKSDDWIVPVVHTRLVTFSQRRGYHVEYVEPTDTPTQCHVCDQVAVVQDATLRCTTDACPVTQLCCDTSAAVTIAKRANVAVASDP